MHLISPGTKQFANHISLKAEQPSLDLAGLIGSAAWR